MEENPAQPTTAIPPSPLAHASIDSAVSHVPESSNKNTKQNHTKTIIVILCFFLLIGSFAAAAFAYMKFGKGANLASIPKATDTVNQKPLIIGTDATYKPMEFLNEDGQLLGYDIDLATKIGERMDRKIEIINIPWDDLFAALESGKLDLIVSGVTITQERKEKYTFSDAYINAGQVIITRKDTDISSTNDLQNKKVAVQKGTTNETEALKYTSKESVITYDDFISATNALVNGEVDAIFSDLTNAKGIVDENPSLTIAGEPFTSEYYGIVLRKNDTQLQKEVNSALEELRQQGVLVYLKQKWLE